MSNPRGLLQALNQSPIAYYPLYCDLTGSLSAGVLLSQIMYLYGVWKKPFFHTDAQFIEECRLSANELRGAKLKLKELPWLEISRTSSIPPRTSFQIDWDQYCAHLINFVETTKLISWKPQDLYKENKTKRVKLHLGARGAQPGDTWYALFAKKLQDALKDAGKSKKSNRVDQWARAFKLLNTEDGFTTQEIKKVLKWYCHQLRKGLPMYVPQAYSGVIFREKYLRLRDAMERSRPAKEWEPASESDRKMLVTVQKAFEGRGVTGVNELVRGLLKFQQRMQKILPSISSGPWILETVLSGRPLFNGYVGWIKERVSWWEQWDGDLKPFYVGGKHFIGWLRSRLNGGNLLRPGHPVARRVLDEAQEG